VPAVSKAQSRFLNARFGHEWVKEHHFDNSTHGLPAYKSGKKRHVLRDVYGHKGAK
jgi:hypothetical protein